MKRLFISDIHANLPAFRAVLEQSGDYSEVVFAGDAVGFGPHPAECVELLMDLRPLAVRGNHDTAVLSAKEQKGSELSPASTWDDWSFRRLGKRHIDFLEGLPGKATLETPRGRALLTHNLPGKPYISPASPDSAIRECLGNPVENTVITGHSHHPVKRTVDGRLLVCLPSAGQPRNRSPLAGYALEENGEIEFKFAGYDVERTARDIERIGLPAHFVCRWIRFLRTGYDSEWSRE